MPYKAIRASPASHTIFRVTMQSKLGQTSPWIRNWGAGLRMTAGSALRGSPGLMKHCSSLRQKPCEEFRLLREFGQSEVENLRRNNFLSMFVERYPTRG